MKTLVLLFSLHAVAVVADDRQSFTTNVPVIVSSNSYLVRNVVTNEGWAISRYRYRTGTNWNEGESRAIVLPYTFKDTTSGNTLHVESDGRHVTATSPDGKVLWRRDPFADAHLRFYRTRTPHIVWIGQSGSEGIRIAFNSSQFGTLDIRTGDFTFQGQD